MDKKIFRLVIITIVLIMIICLLVIYALVDMGRKDNETVTSSITTEELEAALIDDPVGDDGMKIHTSENGYSVKYPAYMDAKCMAKSVDFILEDPNSGSSLNIVTAKNDGSVKKFTKEEFENSLNQTSEGSQLLSYEDIVLNGAEAVVAEFIYMENHVKQVICLSDSYAYNITLMTSSDITDGMLKVFENVINSFTLN
ncbi:MAG: hypothetical protein II244_03110 [Clostridia bacterium]|nr:hypothetical protein [Clostridia bacterium]